MGDEASMALFSWNGHSSGPESLLVLSFPGKLRLALGVPQHHLGETQTKANSPLPCVWVRLTRQSPDFKRRD